MSFSMNGWMNSFVMEVPFIWKPVHLFALFYMIVNSVMKKFMSQW